VSYPSPAEMGIDTAYNGPGNAYALYEGRRETPSPMEALAAFLEGQDYPMVLLSSEWLLNAHGEFLRRLVETTRASGANVVALAYVREQREWLISRYAQAIKSKRWTIPLADYFAQTYRTRKLDYHIVFSRIAELFGRENLVIRIFERAKLRAGDVRVDAFDVVGVDVEGLATEDRQTNASASLEELAVMRFINQTAPTKPFDHRQFLRNSQAFWQETGNEPTKDLYRLVPPALLREAGEYFGPLNERFRQEFFPEEPEPLFSTKIPDDYEQIGEHDWINERAFGLLVNHVMTVLDGRRARRRARAVATTRRGD
jgi:hypothetical protein